MKITRMLANAHNAALMAYCDKDTEKTLSHLIRVKEIQKRAAHHYHTAVLTSLRSPSC